MKITYPKRVEDTAELSIDGNPVRYPIPPRTGTHEQCFALNADEKEVRFSTGREIAAYAHGALVHRKNEWADQNRVRFPTINYLRFQNVFTIMPADTRYGDLAGGMFVDFDEKGEGTKMQTVVPKDLSGFVVNGEGLLVKDKRIFLPYDAWFKEQWDERNAIVIALVGGEGASSLEETSRDSGRTYKPIWKVNPKDITSPVMRVPVLGGCGGVGWLVLGCDYLGYGDGGCVPRVRNASAEGAKPQKN